MNHVSLDEECDGFPINKNFSARIRATTFAEDYEVDDEIIGRINRLCNEYLDAEHWEKKQRRDSLESMKRLEAYDNTLKHAEEAWHQICENIYASARMIRAPHGLRRPLILESGVSLESNPKYAFRKMRKKVKTAIRGLSFQLDGLPEFGPGRRSSRHRDRLIRHLLNVVNAAIRQSEAGLSPTSGVKSSEDQYDAVSELLDVIGIRIEAKTLRNQFPVSRYYPVDSL